MPDPSFSFAFSLSSSARDPGEWEVRMLARPFDAFSVTASDALVRAADLETVHRLGNLDIRVLQQCDRIRTLSGHADELCRQHGAGFRTRAIESLENLRNRGLLVSERELRTEFGRNETPSAKAALDTLFIRSSGRPRALKRALASIADGRGAGSGISRCIVIDDTGDPAVRRQIDTVIAEAQKRTRVRLVHFGADHRRRLARVLARDANIGEGQLDWFIRGQQGRDQRYGCGINIALLLSAGRRFGLLDDDASLEAVTGNQNPEPDRVALSDHHDYRAAFPVPGAIRPPFREIAEFDPVAAHESWLGRSTGEVIAGLGPKPVRIGDIDSATLAELRTQGRIRFTVNGVFGDPGTHSPRWLFCQPIGQLDDWMQGAIGYQASLRRRWTMRCEPDLRAVVGYSLMTTTLTGIDNTTLMLPTMPHGAGEDSLLGELVRFMDPGSLQLGMPWMLKHQPEQPRTWSADDIARPAALNAGLFFRHFLLNLSRVARSSQHGARAGLLARALEDLARADDCELRAEMVKQVMRMRSEISAILVQRLADVSLPGYLQRDYNRMIEANAGQQDLDPARLAPATGNIRDIAGRYATGMHDWIAAWNSARKIGEADLVEEIIQP